MDEYLALSWATEYARQDEGFMGRRLVLLAQGWDEYCRAMWSGPDQGGACIMRRPKDQPRKWTKAELREVMKETWVVSGDAYIYDPESVSTGGVA